MGGLWPWHSLLKPCGSLAFRGAGKAQVIVSHRCCCFSPRCFFLNSPTSFPLLILVGGRFVGLTCLQPPLWEQKSHHSNLTQPLSSKQPCIIIYLFHKESGRWGILGCSLALPANGCSFYNLLIFFPSLS